MFTLITETLRKCLQAQQHSQLQSGQQQQQTTGNQQQRQQGQQSQQQRQQQQDGQNTQYVWQELLFKRPPLTRTNKGGGGGTGLPSYAGTGTGADKYSSISSIIINGIGTFSQNKRYPLLISTPEPREGDPEVAILALKTLTVFDISENDVLDFANETVVLFLENESPRVQQEAALACIALMLASSPGETGPLPVRGHAAGHIEALLLRLIDKAVSSADITTKLTILRNLSPRFDSHLVRNAVVESLFVLLGDESFEVQESALTIIGRLLRNPLMESYYPRLRNFLADLICALRFTRDVRTKLCSTMLLERLMRVAPRLGCAYADTILPALMPQLSSPNVRLNTAGMTAVGELAAAFPPNLERFHKDFMEPIMNILRDKTTTPEHVARRQATMHTLGELIKATGTAVSTMKLYPVLRRVLFKSVGTEREPSLRMELIRLIGIIGAADPYFYREIHLQETRKIVHTNNAKTSVFSLPTTPVDDKNYNTFVVISALSKILNDPSLVCVNEITTDKKKNYTFHPLLFLHSVTQVP